ncbi:response regulator [Anabaena azotica]|uniref:Response regulator n=1 Tax=Anabaena azotica FACHB-119 TaxID=947527 RepID=A0ABR8D2W2_9NOST|nr:response regulator [Anabaena azotica]MBD2501468.1 response regulator [Anabaena azotica FACHB-119]
MNYKNLKKLKALIADDEDSNQICLTVALEKEGWEVKQAKDGQEAIEKVLAWQPDLLILDNQMPKLTGAEVYQYLQLQKIKLAVVMISGDSKLEKIASDLGIAYYLQRPFDMAEFIQTINSAYENFLKK